MYCCFIYIMYQIAEKGHVKPEKFLDSREKFLVSIATKGGIEVFYFQSDI